MAACLAAFAFGEARGAVTGSGGGASDFFGGAVPERGGFGRREDEEKGQEFAIRNFDFGNGVIDMASVFFAGNIFLHWAIRDRKIFCSVFHFLGGGCEVEGRLAGGFPKARRKTGGLPFLFEFFFGNA